MVNHYRISEQTITVTTKLLNKLDGKVIINEFLDRFILIRH